MGSTFWFASIFGRVELMAGDEGLPYGFGGVAYQVRARTTWSFKSPITLPNGFVGPVREIKGQLFRSCYMLSRAEVNPERSSLDV